MNFHLELHCNTCASREKQHLFVDSLVKPLGHHVNNPDSILTPKKFSLTFFTKHHSIMTTMMMMICVVLSYRSVFLEHLLGEPLKFIQSTFWRSMSKVEMMVVSFYTFLAPSTRCSSNHYVHVLHGRIYGGAWGGVTPPSHFRMTLIMFHSKR